MLLTSHSVEWGTVWRDRTVGHGSMEVWGHGSIGGVGAWDSRHVEGRSWGAWWEDEGAWRDEGMREQGEERTSEGGDEEGGEEVHLCWVPYCHPRAAAWLHPLSFLTYSPWRSRLCRALLVSSAFPMAAPPSSPMSQPAPHSIINHRPSHAQSPSKI